MKEPIKYYNFDKISSIMARNFGTIKKGDEEEYEFILFPMESNLIKINRIHRINNGRRVIEAIHICLFVIDGYLKRIEYELDDYITNENEDYVKSLLMSFDPFTNEEILNVINPLYDLNSIDDMAQYFSTPIKCLIRIEKSVELWTKEYGLNGYFTFLEKQIGQTVKHDDKMNFTVSALRH